jgi:hypothetical protein
MPLDLDLLEELPPVPEPLRIRDPFRRNFFSNNYDFDRDVGARSLYWTLRVSEETEQWAEAVSGLTGYQFAQVGFLADSGDSPLVGPDGRSACWHSAMTRTSRCAYSTGTLRRMDTTFRSAC